MYTVRIERNYQFPNLLEQTPNCLGIWGEFKFTYEPISNPDFILILNHPVRDIHAQCRKNGVLTLIQEPPYEKKNFLKDYFFLADRIVTAFENTGNIKFDNVPAGLPWHINKTYDELLHLKRPTPNEKLNKVSWVTSAKTKFPAHASRVSFVNFLRKKDFDFELFGRGFHEIPNKFDGVFPYKYSIAAENYIAMNYFTEKITDVLLSWSLPFYDGCLNLEKYLPPESFIRINLNKPEESYEIIKNSIQENQWEKRIDAIEKSRKIILDKYHVFPLSSKIFTEQLEKQKSDQRKKIRFDIKPNRFSRILHFFSRTNTK